MISCNMNARTVCRICKTEGVRLYCITNTHLQEMYETETHTLLTTDDNKPFLACIECCDRLQHCYQSRNGIEQRQINLDPQLQIDENYIRQNNPCQVQSDYEVCVEILPEEISDDEVEQESTSDLGYGFLQDDIIELEEDNQNSDADYGLLLPRIIKVESLNVNQNEPNEIARNDELKANPNPRSDNPEDISRNYIENVEICNDADAEETSCEIVSFSESIQNHLTLRKDVRELSICENSDLATHSIVHSGEPKPKPFECQYFKKRFTQRRGLAKHTSTHTGEKPYECDVCKKCFRCKSYLEKHAYIHTGEKPFKCEVCKKCFNQKGYLNTHMRIHTGFKPYNCDVCNKYFVTNSALAVHTRTHTGIKPYKCDVCNKYFATTGTLAVHARTHTDIKPYKCDVCNKYFATTGALAVHARTHTDIKPYKCDDCKKCFKCKSVLAVHARKHAGTRPYKCGVCYKCFNTKYVLALHARTHTSIKPFKCDVCDKRVATKRSLARHARTQHK